MFFGISWYILFYIHGRIYIGRGYRLTQRPDPELLLKRVQEQERHEQRGKLKIYLGAAPGVGKTYTMLQDALAKRAQGLDVVIGVVETHGRQEIQNLIKDFETIPRQTIDYHGQKLSEFDLDATLKRTPGLILIDEMAHTNVPGLRHAKRWQDIKEILDRGIDVYTTLNVQHIESLNDIVSRIIHTRVKETIPDSMLEMADTVELVDLPPEDLLKRLQEGKVYFPKQAELAAENFFRKGNLIALRELALRTTAERVGSQVLLYRQGQGIKHVWPVKEKLLVCVGSSEQSTRLIRAARRLATKLQAEWIAVHVDTPRLRLTEEERNNAIQNLRLAEQLGAETRVISGFDLVKEILDFAHEQNVTQIVLGKQARGRWHEFLRDSLADQLVRRSGEIDIYIITGDAIIPKAPRFSIKQQEIDWSYYLYAIIAASIATFISYLLAPYLDSSNLIMILVLGAVGVALLGQLGPSITYVLFSVVAFTLVSIPPVFTLNWSDIQFFFAFGVMLAISVIISRLINVNKTQATFARMAEQRTATLNVLGRQLASTRGVNKLLNTSAEYIGEVFESQVTALLHEKGKLRIKARYHTRDDLSEKEMGVAQWVYDLGQTAGMGTDTLPYSDAIYVPLLTPQGTAGVLRVKPLQPQHLLSPEQMRLLEACANQIALAIEVDRLHEQAHKSKVEIETDKARSALLQYISHDLRTPLVSILGNASTLIEMASALDEFKVNKIGTDIFYEAEELSRLINNMLKISYLEADSITLQKEKHNLPEILNLTLNSLGEKLNPKRFHLHIDNDLPNVPCDASLIQDALYNLIDNAIKFSAPDTPIDISIQRDDKRVIISVSDRGPGIVPDEVDKLFRKFYRGRMLTTVRGLGLGLPIVRNIVQAHGGEVWTENREGGGASFRISLPLV